MANLFKNMGSCKIQSLTPKCGYQLGGIKEIWVLNKEAFRGYAYSGALEDCKAFGIMRANKFLEVAASEDARYSSNKQKGVYLHSIETFVAGLSSELSASLHNASKTRWVVVFKTASGRSLTFGADAGATIQHEGKTENGEGFTLTISANSTLPLFELTEETVNIETLESICADWAEGKCLHKVLARVSKSGEPLDVNCIPTRFSGKKQGVYLARGEEVGREEGIPFRNNSRTNIFSFKNGSDWNAYQNDDWGCYLEKLGVGRLRVKVIKEEGTKKGWRFASFYISKLLDKEERTICSFKVKNSSRKIYPLDYFLGEFKGKIAYARKKKRPIGFYFSWDDRLLKATVGDFADLEEFKIEIVPDGETLEPSPFSINPMDADTEVIETTYEIIAYFAPGEAVEGFATKEEGCIN